MHNEAFHKSIDKQQEMAHDRVQKRIRRRSTTHKDTLKLDVVDEKPIAAKIGHGVAAGMMKEGKEAKEMEQKEQQETSTIPAVGCKNDEPPSAAPSVAPAKDVGKGTELATKKKQKNKTSGTAEKKEEVDKIESQVKGQKVTVAKKETPQSGSEM